MGPTEESGVFRLLDEGRTGPGASPAPAPAPAPAAAPAPTRAAPAPGAPSGGPPAPNTRFLGFSQNSQGGLDATAQLGGNVQAPQLAGVQFNRPNTALGVQPTLLGQGRPDLNLFNLFGR